MTKTITREWLKIQAKSMERNNLNQYGISLSFANIYDRFFKAVEECYNGNKLILNIMAYKKIRKSIRKLSIKQSKER